MGRSSRGRVGVVGAMAIVLGLSLSCASPTLPLPPPGLPSVSAGATPNTFHLRSQEGALPNALVIAVNYDPTLPSNQRVAGTFADSAGSWELDVYGKVGDEIDISQESESTTSPTTTVTLR